MITKNRLIRGGFDDRVGLRGRTPTDESINAVGGSL
jgi:hypothetical protein